MNVNEAAALLCEHWLVMPLTHEEKQAIRALCAELYLPDPGVQRRYIVSSKPRHPWGEPEVLPGNDYR